MSDTKPEKLFLYVGTYTRREPHVEGKSGGIEIVTFDTESGKLARADTVSGIENPSFIAIHPQGNALYAISEVGDFEGKAAGGIYAYAIDPNTKGLTKLNGQSVKGPGPAYVSIDSKGRHVLVANYGGGSVCVLPVRKDLTLATASAFVQHEGSSINPQRQEAPHAHSIVLDPSDRYALVADLGLDKVMIYRYDDEAGTVKPNADQSWARTKSGAGPRHIVFHPNEQYVYVINELDSTVIAYRWSADKGGMTELQTISTLPEDWEGRNYPADIHVHPNGRYLYGSNRGHNSIAAYDVNPETGELCNFRAVPSGGEYPRGFTLTPDGDFALVANQNSSNLLVYAIDQQTGDLTATGEVLDLPTPVCVKVYQ